MTRKQSTRKPLTHLPKIETGPARYAKRLVKQINRLRKSQKKAAGIVLAFMLLGSTGADAQSLNDVYQWTQFGSRKVGQFRALYTTTILEGTNLWYTDARVRNALSAVLPLSYNPSSGAFSLTGLSSIGGAHTIVGVNSAGTGLQYKKLIPGANISISYSGDTVLISGTGGAAGGTLKNMREVDGSPSLNNIDSLEVDQANGLTLTSVAASKARISLQVSASVEFASLTLTGNLDVSGTVFLSVIGGVLRVDGFGEMKRIADVAAGSVLLSGATAGWGKIDSVHVNPGQITSSLVKDSSLQRADVTPSFKSPYADTADVARLSIVPDSLRGYGYMNKNGDTSWYAVANMTTSGQVLVAWADSTHSYLGTISADALSGGFMVRSNADEIVPSIRYVYYILRK